eukprot:GHVT01042661.1.p1 GENE.GHVT01042661.1~~GHVT01042661.1.p1  ORF type:complete len:476 (+),score=122.28 GHVT01042661.1:231-1658(+)
MFIAIFFMSIILPFLFFFFIVWQFIFHSFVSQCGLAAEAAPPFSASVRYQTSAPPPSAPSPPSHCLALLGSSGRSNVFFLLFFLFFLPFCSMSSSSSSSCSLVPEEGEGGEFGKKKEEILFLLCRTLEEDQGLQKIKQIIETPAISFCFPSFADSSNRRRVFDQLASVFEAEEKKNGRQESMARGVLADEFSKRGDFVSAAKIFELGKSNSIEEWLPSHQIEWLVKMAGLQLLGGLVQSAEVSVARGNSLRRRLTADARKENEKILRSLQLLHAQVADHRGKFEAAFFRYAELSRAERADSDSDNFFTSAVACAILAAPGPEKEQIGATLMKDRRFFSSRHLTLATQIFQRKFIGPEQLQTFAATLLPHHLAVQPSGYRLLDECIQLHNVCAAPLFFRNAALPHMAQLLQCSEGQLKKMLVRAIVEKRVAATVDQVADMICFTEEKENGWRLELKKTLEEVEEMSEVIAEIEGKV